MAWVTDVRKGEAVRENLEDAELGKDVCARNGDVVIPDCIIDMLYRSVVCILEVHTEFVKTRLVSQNVFDISRRGLAGQTEPAKAERHVQQQAQDLFFPSESQGLQHDDGLECASEMS